MSTREIMKKAWIDNIDKAIEETKILFEKEKNYLKGKKYPYAPTGDLPPPSMEQGMIPIFLHCRFIEKKINELNKLKEETPESIDAKKKMTDDANAKKTQTQDFSELEEPTLKEDLMEEEDWDTEPEATPQPSVNVIIEPVQLKSAFEHFNEIAKLSDRLEKEFEKLQGRSTVQFTSNKELEAAKKQIATEEQEQAVQPPMLKAMQYLKRQQAHPDVKNQSKVSDTPDIPSRNPKKPKR